MRLQPVLYDLKRGFLRFSTLALLALFTVLGVGLGYYTYSVLMTTPPDLGEHVAVFQADLEAGELWMDVLSFAPPDIMIQTTLEYRIVCYNYTEIYESALGGAPNAEEPLDIRKLVEERGKVIAEGSIRFPGRYEGRTQIEKLNITLGDLNYADFVPDLQCILNYNISSVFVHSFFSTYLHVAPKETGGVVIHGVASSGQYRVYLLRASGYPITVWSSYVYTDLFAMRTRPILKENGEIVLVGGLSLPGSKSSSVELFVRPVYSNTTPPQGAALEDVGYRKVADVSEGVFIVKFKLLDAVSSRNELAGLDVIFKASLGNEEVYAPLRLNFIGEDYEKRVQGVTMLALISSLYTFQLFFPVAVIYLAYVYIAKPRSQGALEFILARPITRTDIFFTRYIAGVLVIAIATLLFVFTTLQAITFLVGVTIDAEIATLLLAGMVLSMVEFYSLCYLLASATRGVRYIAVSLIAYLFFSMIVSIILSMYVVFTESTEHFTRLQYASRHFNPFGVFYFALYYVETRLGVQSIDPKLIEDVVAPHLIALSTTVWITVPVFAGWLIFRKANLSG